MTTIDDINRQIQQEKESYSRNLNRLQQEILNLKQRHQRRISDLQNQKQQAISQIKHECLGNQYKLLEYDFIHINRDLKKFL